MAKYQDYRIEEITYRLESIHDMSERHVYLRFIAPDDEGWYVVSDGRNYAMGWEITTLEKDDLAYFMSHLDDFYDLQLLMLGWNQTKQKLADWKANGPGTKDVSTLFKNMAYALRWFRIRSHE